MTSLKALKTWAFFFSPQRKTNVTLAAVKRDSSWSWPPGGRQPGKGSSPPWSCVWLSFFLDPSGQSGEKVPVPVPFYMYPESKQTDQTKEEERKSFVRLL